MKHVGRELGVRYVLEGSVRKAGNRIRVTGQLIDATTGAHIWAERLDRELTDIFAVQDDLTQEIISALKIKLSKAERALIAGAGTKNVDAHDFFLRGRELLLANRRDRETFERSTAYFRRAIELNLGLCRTICRPRNGIHVGLSESSERYTQKSRWMKQCV